jgi:hypothetical protein
MSSAMPARDDRPSLVCLGQCGGQRFDMAAVEACLFEALRKLSDIARSDRSFRDGMSAESDVLHTAIADRRRSLDKEIAQLTLKIDGGRDRLALIDPSLFEGFQRSLVQWQKDLDTLQRQRALSPGHAAAFFHDDQEAQNFLEAMETYVAHLPLVPDSGPRSRMYDHIRKKLLESVRVTANPEGGHDLKFRIRAAMAGTDLATAVVREIVLTGRTVEYSAISEQHRQDVTKLAISDRAMAITDAEVELLEGVRGLRDLSIDIFRTALDVILTAGALLGEVSLYAVAKRQFDDERLAWNLYVRASFMLSHMDTAEVERRLSEHRGVSVICPRPVKARASSGMTSRLALRHHPILMVKLAREGDVGAVLSDQQWQSIEPFLPAKWKDKNPREFFDTLFHALREDLALAGALNMVMIRKLNTLNRGNMLTNIVGTLLGLEGWDLAPGTVVETLRCEGRAEKGFVDVEAERLKIAKALVNLGGDWPPAPPKRKYYKIGNVEVEPVAGLIRNAAGLTVSFPPCPVIQQMIDTPEQWIPWLNDDKRSRLDMQIFYRTLKKLGWRQGDSSISISARHGVHFIPTGADAAGNPFKPKFNKMRASESVTSDVSDLRAA